MLLVVIGACETSPQRSQNVHSGQIADLVNGKLFDSVEGFLNGVKVMGEIEGVINEQLDLVADSGCGGDEEMLYLLFGMVCICKSKGGKWTDRRYGSAY